MKQIHFVKLLLVAVLAGGNILACGAVTLGSDWNTLFGTSYDGAFTLSANALSLSGTDNGVIITIKNGKSTNGYIKTSDFRAYNGYTITISSTNKITAISTTKGGKTFTSGITADVGNGSITNNTYNWTGNANSIQLSISGTVSFASITVTYESGSGETTNYTVQWMVDGQPYTTGNPTTSVKSGERVTTLPTDPADNSLSCAEKFMGWSAEHIGKNPQDNAPADLFTTADASPAITENTTFYAVFASPQK